MRSKLAFVLVALTVTGAAAAVIAPAQTEPVIEPADPACLVGAAAFTPYWIGPSFEGLRLTDAEHVCSPPDEQGLGGINTVIFDYGDCHPPAGGGCALPLEISSSALCKDHAKLYAEYDAHGNQIPGTTEPYQQTTLRGVPMAVFGDGTTVELYAGNTTIHIYGDSAQQVRRAAGQVRVFGRPIAEDPLPAPDPHVLNSTKECV